MITTRPLSSSLSRPLSRELVWLTDTDGLSLDLQFATDKTLTARKGPTPVFTRASTATFVGSNGLIQSAAINAARFDHDPLSPFACKGLLIEESRTNLILQSDNFASASWVKTVSVVSSNVSTAPDGSGNADKLVTDSGSTQGRATQTLTLTGSHVCSVFAKAGEWGWLSIFPLSATGGVWFNLTNGTIGTQQSGFVGSITSFGDGWYRCAVQCTGIGTSNTTARIISTNANGVQSTGDGTSGIFIWGAQLEAGSFPTSYIPTTTAPMIRSADVCSITGESFTGFWNPSEGSLFASGISRGSLVMASSGANVNQIAIFRNPSPLYMRFDVASGGTYTAQIISATIADGSFNKTAGSYATNDARAAFNGTLGTADITVTVPSNLTTLNIGSQSLGNLPHNGHIAAIRYFRKRLPNAKLQALTV